MPTYEYTCDSCSHDFVAILRMSEYDAPQACPECGVAPAKKRVSQVHVVFAGDTWVSKNNLIERQMADKNRRQAARQEERKRAGTGMTLAPNVAGERVDTWSEAAKLATSKGISAASFEQKARETKQS